MMAMVMPRVLHRVLVMLNRRHERMPKLNKMLSKVKVMLLLATWAGIVVLMPEVKPARCDEGYHTWTAIGNFVDLTFKSCA
jgi:hypothetical protein